MASMKRFVIGVRPAYRMFRVSSLGGLIADTILAARGKNGISPDYFRTIGKDDKGNAIRLSNDDLGNFLHLDIENVVFTKETQDDDFIDVEHALIEFKTLWKIIDGLLKVTHIRRLGMVATYQSYSIEKSPSLELIKALTNISAGPYPRKFYLRYEDRLPTLEGLAPDIDASDFINVIYTYYDSETSRESSEEAPNPTEAGSINADIDVQRYYHPYLSSLTAREIDKAYQTFLAKINAFETRLAAMKLTYGHQEKTEKKPSSSAES